MQTVSEEFAEASGKFEHDLMAKLKIQDEEKENHEEVEEEEEEEEEEFTFVFTNPDGSPISADEAFDNGQIRPVFPVFNQELLFGDGYDFDAGPKSPIKKVFVQQLENSPSSSSSTATDSSESDLAAPEGPYCEWTPKTAVKSNSTGFSKLWRVKDLKLRSNSDGKDTFVFLHPPPVKAEKASSGEARNVVLKKVKGKTTSSAHEKHYMVYRAKKESDKRKSYLPYKQDLFGFFANANGLTRNLHPY